MSKSIFYSLIFVFIFLSNASGQNSNDNADTIHKFGIDTSRFVVMPVNINSSSSDYCPILINNEMVFTSDRQNVFGIVYSNKTERPLVDLFVAIKIDSITFHPVKSFSKIINTQFNDGPATFNRENDLFYFSSNSNYKFDIKELYKKEDVSKLKNLQLYVSQKLNNEWGKPQLLSFCNQEFSYAHPCLSKDGKILFFSSTMTGGHGGMDIYSSNLENGQWTKPVNLGSEINTAANEVFPFISKENTLYFSSDLASGYGGLDVYSFDMNDPMSSLKHLLEYPLNSEFDDFGVDIDSVASNGYFSSNRNSKMQDDIYYFNDKYPYFNDCKQFKQPSNCYTFYEESSETNLQADDNKSLIYEWDLGDGTKIRGLEAKHCYNETGDYKVELNIIEKQSGALFYNEVSYDFTVVDSEQVYIHAPDTTAFNQSVNINAFNSKIPGYTITNYFWNFGTNLYSSDKSGAIIFNKEGSHTIRLGIQARNDLTNKVENFCIEKNIYIANSSWKETKRIRISARMKAEIAFSNLPLDSLNFRVYLGGSYEKIPLNSDVFKDLKNVKEFRNDSIYGYTSGQTDKIIDILPEYANAKRVGFEAAMVVRYSGDSLLPNQQKALSRLMDGGLIKDYKLSRKDMPIFQKNFFFDFNSYEIKESYLTTLDSLAKVLDKNKLYRILIVPSTNIFAEDFFETVPTLNYNLILIKQRGNSVTNYFMNKGILKDRISVKQKGDQYPGVNIENKSHYDFMARATIYIIK